LVFDFLDVAFDVAVNSFRGAVVAFDVAVRECEGVISVFDVDRIDCGRNRPASNVEDADFAREDFLSAVEVRRVEGGVGDHERRWNVERREVDAEGVEGRVRER
jgi:hypothetical protein